VLALEQKIKWLSDWNQALENSAMEDRPVLLDFFLPG
jgi:hypothetical protein